MRYGNRKVGPTFGTKVGQLVMHALTCANRKDFDGYRKTRNEIDQMLDTVAEEAGFDEWFERAPDVAAVRESGTESEGDPSEAEEGGDEPSEDDGGVRASIDGESGDGYEEPLDGDSEEEEYGEE